MAFFEAQGGARARTSSVAATWELETVDEKLTDSKTNELVLSAITQLHS